MKRYINILILTLSLSVLLPLHVLAGENWAGTDDLVDGKMTEVAGVSAHEPLIDISQGNLGLFIFGAGGFAAGVIVGYQWRKLFAEGAGKPDD